MVENDNKMRNKRSSGDREDNMIARSLPINPALAKGNDRELASMMPKEKSVQSHINSKQLVSNLKLNEVNNRRNMTDSIKNEGKPIKYYASIGD